METDTEMMDRLQELSANPESWDEDVSPDDKAAIRRALELIEHWRNCSAANPNVCTCGWAAIRDAALSQDPPPARR